MKKIFDEIVNIIVIAGAVAAHYWFSDRYRFPCDPLAVLCLVPGVWILYLISFPPNRGDDFLTLGGMSWSQADFVRGWLITGKTGSGKTAAAICNIIEALFKNGQNWGGICIDDKGLFFQILVKACKKFNQEDRLALLQVRPEEVERRWLSKYVQILVKKKQPVWETKFKKNTKWTPKFKYNLISDPLIPSSSYAKTIIDVTKSLGGEGGNPFFIGQAGIQIEKAIDLLRIASPKNCTLKGVYEFFASEDDMAQILSDLAESDDSEEAYNLIKHFSVNYMKQPKDQRGGIKTTIESCLSYFTQPDIAEVFCPEENTIDLGSIDNGVIIAVSLPNKYDTERRYINTFMKLGYYKHALRRFDKSEVEREQDNLLVLIADEAQQIVTSSQSGTSDFNVIDKIREAKATGIYASQSTTSFIPAFGSQEKTNVFLLNLGNHIYFTLADPLAAELAAKNIGERTIQQYTHNQSAQGASQSHTAKDEFSIKPMELRKMKKFHCVLIHCEKGWKKAKLKPTSLTKPTEASSNSKEMKFINPVVLEGDEGEAAETATKLPAKASVQGRNRVLLKELKFNDKNSSDKTTEERPPLTEHDDPEPEVSNNEEVEQEKHWPRSEIESEEESEEAGEGL